MEESEYGINYLADFFILTHHSHVDIFPYVVFWMVSCQMSVVISGALENYPVDIKSF